MRNQNVWASVAGLSMVLMGLLSPSAQASIFIHEILADPPMVIGDANRDGAVSSTEDEFIEFYNDSMDAVDLSGWMISDTVKVRHVFAENSWIDPSGVFVVFGGGQPNLPMVRFDTASTGSLGLNNSGDEISLFNLDGVFMDSWAYGAQGANDQSLVRIGQDVFLHTDLDPEKLFSPGAVTQNPAHAVPEPGTLLTLLSGICSGLVFKKRLFREKL